MPRKKTAPSAPTDSSSPAKVNKSAYVRGLPATMKASEVVTKGASEGIKLTLAQVYIIRANARKAAAKGANKRAVGRPKGSKNEVQKHPAPSAPRNEAPQAPRNAAPMAGRANAAPTNTPANSAHNTFVMAALDLGLNQAEQLLRDLRTKLHTLYPLN